MSRLVGFRSLALVLALALGGTAMATKPTPARPVAAAPTIGGKYHDAIPAIALSGKAAAARAKHPLIEKYRKAYVAKARAGELDVVEPEDAEVVKQQGKLTSFLEARPGQRPVLVVLEGFDGAGKSSTIRRMQAAVGAANVDFQVQHFGAPPAGERKWWPRTYLDKLPNQGQFKVFDRSWYGRAVYDRYFGMVGKKTVKARLKQIAQLEAAVGADIDIVKIFLDASPDRLARTIGKREVEKPEILSSSDYVTFDDQAQIRGLFDDARKRTGGWTTVSMDDRASGRAQILRAVRKELEAKDAKR